MKRNKVVNLLIVFGILFTCLYMIFAGINLKKELQLTPCWTVDFQKDLSSLQKDKTSVFQLKTAEEITEKQIPFKLSQNLGYFTPSGKVTAFQTFSFMASVSSDYWVIFYPDSKSQTIYKNDGQILCKIPCAGFPFIEQNKIFVFSPGGTGISSFNEEGKEIWTYESYVPVTAFKSSPSSCVAGLADGTLLYYDSNASKPQKIVPGGSDYNVILGADVSQSGKLLACVSGIEKQRFILIKLSDGQHKIIFHSYLDGNITEQTFVEFSKEKTDEETVVYFQYEKGMGIYSFKSNSIKTVPIKGKILSVSEVNEKNVVFVLTQTDEKHFSINMIDENFVNTGSITFPAKNAFMITDEGSLYIGKDSSISRFDLKIK